MVKLPKSEQLRVNMSDDAPQLYLVTPLLQEASNFKLRLVQALEAANIASLLIRADHKDMRRKDRKSTRLNSSHIPLSRMPSSA